MTSLDLLEAAPTGNRLAGTALDAIRDCDGFRVLSAEGYIGAVELVLYGAAQQPAALAVRTGIFARQLVLVPVEEVGSVHPVRRTLVLTDSWRPASACVTEGFE
jgi:hypothetical protein